MHAPPASLSLPLPPQLRHAFFREKVGQSIGGPTGAFLTLKEKEIVISAKRGGAKLEEAKCRVQAWIKDAMLALERIAEDLARNCAPVDLNLGAHLRSLPGRAAYHAALIGSYSIHASKRSFISVPGSLRQFIHPACPFKLASREGSTVPREKHAAPSENDNFPMEAVFLAVNLLSNGVFKWSDIDFVSDRYESHELSPIDDLVQK